MKLKKFTSTTTLADGRIYPVYTEVPDQETANQIIEAAKNGLTEPEEIVYEEYFDGGLYQMAKSMAFMAFVVLVLFVLMKELAWIQ